MQGIIYIIRNPLEEEHIYKIGQTKNSWRDRARSGETFSSQNFELVEEYPVIDRFAAEAAAHKSLEQYKIRNEVFKCEIELLKANVRISIDPFLASNSNRNSEQHKWLLDFITEYQREHGHIDPNCGLCRAENSRTANELMMRMITDPVGLPRERRTIHNQRSVNLMSNDRIGIVLTEAMKHIDIEQLVNLDTWFNKLDFIFSLDSETGFLVKEDLLPPIEECDERQRIGYHRNQRSVVIKIKNFNINEVIAYWSQSILIHNAKLLEYCSELVNNKRHDIDFGFVTGAKVAVTKAARDFFERHFESEELSFFKDIGHNIMGDEFPDYLQISREYGEEDFQNKQKLIELFNRKKEIENKKEEKARSLRRQSEIEQLKKEHQISAKHAAILVDKENLNYHFYINNKDRLKLGRQYDISSLEVLLHARDNKCSLDESLITFYNAKDKEFNLSQKTIQEERREKLKIQKKKEKIQIDNYVEYLNITEDQAKKIIDGLTFKELFGYKYKIKTNEDKEKKKVLLEQRTSLTIRDKNKLLEELKSKIENKFDFLGFKVSIDKKLSVCHILSPNNEKLATLTNVGGYKLWFFGEFPFQENMHFDNLNDLIENCLNFNRPIKKKNNVKETFDEIPAITNNNTKYLSSRVDFTTIFFIAAIIIIGVLLYG